VSTSAIPVPATAPPETPLLVADKPHIGDALFWLAAIAVFFVFPEDLAFATKVVVTAMFVLSLDLILGHAGIISLGHALFFGLGAYAAGLAALHGWREPISVALFGMAVGALAAALTGWFVLRLRDLPLMMVTLALGVMTFEAANKATWLTGGDDGMVGLEFSPIFGVFEWSFYSTTSYVYVLIWLAVAFFACRRLVGSPFGMALRGARENHRRMSLIGADVHAHLVRVYVIGGGLAGLAGALSAETTKFVGLSDLSVDASIAALVMLVVGGVGRLYGALIGTAVYMITQHVAAQWNPYHWMFVIGGLLVLVVMFARGGLLGLLDKGLALVRPKCGGSS
jgi:branched-chain amino acid transport system permease protein